MRILFMGTPDFAVPSLDALLRAGHRLTGVFTQPDKPVGRHQNRFQAPPVKEYALAHGIPVFQSADMRDGTALAQVKAWDPELIVVAAFGRLLPDEILAYPAKGCINVHSSLLPRYRGAAPINWAILNGDRTTGVTIMYMAHQLDAGDVLLTRSTEIGADETAPELFIRLAALGGELAAEAADRIARGTAAATPQDHSKATLAPMLSRAMSPMDWDRTARALHAQVRGLLPWPAATAQLGGVRCKVLKTAVPEETTEKAPGTILQADKNGLKVACGGGTVLELLTLQPDGKKPMEASAFLQGHPIGT